MSETCRPGMNYLYQLYEQEQNEVSTSLQEEVHNSSLHQGMAGDDMPYKMRSDWLVTVVLFVCFIITSYVLRKGYKYLQVQIQSFFSTKDRNSFFDDKTASDARYRLFLIAQSCLLSGFCLYDLFYDFNVELFSTFPGYILLSFFVMQICIYFLFKFIAFKFINWIFFNKEENKVWLGAYFNVVIFCGFYLFPLVLLITYFDLPVHIVIYSLLFILIFAKILLFYKCFSNFFSKIHGFFLLILYFCALEILPDFVLWKGIVLVNNYLVLNY